MTNEEYSPQSPRPQGRLTPEQLQRRIERFGDLAGDVVPDSTRSRRLQHYGGQLTRCSSSAGAAYSEARSATSRKEFEHKLHDCAKELRESLTWLNRIAHVTQDPLRELRDECENPKSQIPNQKSEIRKTSGNQESYSQ
jgi:four helix bundle protein